ncbi:phosphate signaling complex protein PhoU [Salipaludibacillus daqingensis]|uniref:phosphate signaling complex protein PhoU n=1 Tax=Salipaludibacillus daqingensis TaxID=3041001 RepID=UPI002474014D|nr:phosphate signaling complex protein PhoU [Salipaludibacillus daqingensis]
MPMREGFLTKLSELKEEIMLLGSMVEKSFVNVVTGIEKNNQLIFDDVIENDHHVNSLELDINEKATLLIAKQQPVASDLRKIIVALKISSDLERVGDLAVDMAKAANRINGSKQLETYHSDLIMMANKTQKMLRDVLRAYQSENVIDAQYIANVDDEIDEAYGAFVQSIFKIKSKDEETTELITQLVFIARYIERIADYSTNIAEWIIYEVNGERFDLN